MASNLSGGDEPEFQVAPMVDVLLVLLVFFMAITSAQVLKVDQNLTLPVSPNARKKDPNMVPHEVAINIRWDTAAAKAMVTLDDRLYPERSAIVPILQARHKNDPQLRVVIRGDKALPAVEVEKVMNLVGEAGIAEVAFAATNN